MDLGLRGKKGGCYGWQSGDWALLRAGIGKREGARVCIAARTRETLDAVVAEIGAAGGEGHAVAVDLTRGRELRGGGE